MRRFDNVEVLKAFKSLGPDHSESLRMFALDNLSYQEIAARLGVPVGTVMSRIFRARRNLVRTLLESGIP